MAVNDISDEAILKATGAPWKHWLEVFAIMDAKSLPHKEIARKLHEDHKVPNWWCQMLTVKFEYAIGRRDVGQANEGTFSVGTSLTVDGELDDTYLKWVRTMAERKEYNTVKVVEPPTVSQTEKWRYWKLKLEDNSRIYMNFSQKAPGKVLVQLEHDKLQAAEASEQWKVFWKAQVNDVFAQ